MDINFYPIMPSKELYLEGISILSKILIGYYSHYLTNLFT